MQGTIEFSLEQCCSCGMAFYVTADFQARRQADGKSFCCPLGHGQHYTETTEEKLRKQLEAEKANKEHFRQQAEQNRMDRERVERRLTAMKGQVTKANDKLKKGVCPCCEQQFPDLEIHIKQTHPDFDIDQSGTTDPTFEPPKTPPAKPRGRPRKVKATT